MLPHDARVLSVGSRFNAKGRIWRVFHVSKHARTARYAYVEASTVPRAPPRRGRTGRQRSFRLDELYGFDTWRLP